MGQREFAGLVIAVYARFSSDLQSDASIEDQVHRCVEYVERRGGNVPNHLIFEDHATSGASLARSGYEKLARLFSAKPRGVDVVVIEDLSRISRNAADLFRLQQHLQFVGVRLVGMSDGIDTAASHSKLTFGMQSVMADMFISQLADKTRRGLEGRARAGCATGGVSYGYALHRSSETLAKTSGTEIVVEEDQAKVVRRIFALYLEGHSLAGVAKRLNSEKVPPPRVFAPGRRSGWKDSTIRAILHNKSYTGVWTYGTRTWRKVPGTNRRQPAAGPQPMEFVRPHLRIVDAETWDAVQERLRAVHAHYTVKTEPHGERGSRPGRKSRYLFSSLLRCSVCGSSMVISGGSSKAYYRCEGYCKRGTCTNALSISEPVVRTGLLDEVRRRLCSEGGIAYARAQLGKRLEELRRSRGGEAREQRDLVSKVESQITKLVEFISEGNSSKAVAEKLKALEAELSIKKRTLGALERHDASPMKLPDPNQMMEMVFDLERRLETDIERGREELRHLFRDGKVTLEPQADGTYLARSAILPLVLLAKTPPGEPHGGRYTAIGCAGRI